MNIVHSTQTFSEKFTEQENCVLFIFWFDLGFYNCKVSVYIQMKMKFRDFLLGLKVWHLLIYHTMRAFIILVIILTEWSLLWSLIENGRNKK